MTATEPRPHKGLIMDNLVSSLPLSDQLAMALAAKASAEAAATRLANALKDIYNDIGEMPEVFERLSEVQYDVENYAEN